MGISAENIIGNPSLALDADTASFPAPWAARTFAMTRTLSINGHFTWTEWAHALGRELHLHQVLFQSQMSEDLAYYRCWVNALESLLQAKGLVNSSSLQSATSAAVANWPHPDHHAHLEPVAVSPSRI
jgi:nitrile hydratase accessory protein